MEINEWAESLLFGKTLSDKTSSPDKITDNSPKKKPALKNLTQPGRSKQLRISQEKRKFPSLRDLETEIGRAEALHSFANHELLAIETMAFTLLLFPDSPKNFRRGIVSTIKDEQKHLGLYIERLRELGKDFGDFPLNDFFWKSLREINSPIDFTVRMSLMFEQANLDFATFYKDFFARMGDDKTASILDTVLVDEIRHVKHGLHWFDEWKNPNLDRWSQFSELLPFPLTPQRAKGTHFYSEPRIKAGLDQDFIQELSTYSASKGRVPNLFVFWPDCEDELATQKYQRPQNTQHFADDLAFVPAYSASVGDAILLPKKPENDFLLPLKKAGFNLPEVLTSSDIEKRRFHEFKPWGWGKGAHTFIQKNKEHFLKQEPKFDSDVMSKTWSCELMQEFAKKNKESFIIKEVDCGVICKSVDEITKATEKILQSHSEVVVKAPFGASGRGFQKLTSVDLHPNYINRFTNILKKQESVVVEPWLDKQFDYSLQITVKKDSPPVIHGQARFLADKRGAYRGALIGGFTTGLSKDLIQFTNGFGKDKNRMQRHFKNLAEFVSEKCAEKNYEGPIGIDALVFKNKGNEFKIKPIVEMNCRYNMGRIVVDLEKNLNHRGVGLWRIFHIKELEKMGYSSIDEFKEKLKESDTSFLETSYSIHKKVFSFLFKAKTIPELAEITEFLGIALPDYCSH